MEIKHFLHLLKQKEEVSPLDLAYFEVLNQDSHPLVSILDLKQEAQLVHLCDLSKIQDPFRLKSCRRAERISAYLIDPKGEIDQDRLVYLLELLKSSHIIYLNGSNDQEILDHIIPILESLKPKGALAKALKRFFLPLAHRGAEGLIRNVFGLSESEPITNTHLKRGVLSACLTLLKQSVGSCFATAPCILIQQEQPEVLIEDLYQLLMTGRLKRVFGGEEYTVPLSLSSGVGELKRKISYIKGSIGYSPGLIAAFASVGRFDFNQTLTTRHLVADWLDRPEVSDCDLLITAVLLDPNEREMAKAAFKRVVEHPLLKAWEYTVASFAEFKTEFSGWNLFVSLGLDPEAPGGIGQILYQEIDHRLQEFNQKIAEYQKEYEESFQQVKLLEGLLKSATNEDQIRRLKGEHQIHGYRLVQSLDARDRYHKTAKQCSHLFSTLIDQYNKKFPLYFQEIYDPEILELAGSFYDDKPAGFRLVYKHGRQDASLWTLVQNEKQYIDSLIDFFQLTERQIEGVLEEDFEKEEFLKLTTAVILHLQTREFIDSALSRIQQVNPEDRYRFFRKPWCYISGGSMEHLLKVYFKREQEFTKETKSPQNVEDLIVFMIELIKELPSTIYHDFTEEKSRSILMNSPTHAFSLRPGLPMFRQGWQDRGFTYSWVRDHLNAPAQLFYDKITLSKKAQELLVDEYARTLPFHFASTFLHDFKSSDLPMMIDEFRTVVLSSLERTAHAGGAEIRGLFEESLDRYLTQSLPLSTRMQLESFVGKEWELPGELWTCKAVLQLALLSRIKQNCSVVFPDPIFNEVVEQGRGLSLFAPPPIVFADTNWPDFYFAAFYYPGTKKAELFRTDLFGLSGIPMRDWDPYFRGDPSLLWTLYTHPGEYRF